VKATPHPPGRRVKQLLVALLAICLTITLREPRPASLNFEQVALSGTLVWIVASGRRPYCR
jgi:hypothetical protein